MEDLIGLENLVAGVVALGSKRCLMCRRSTIAPPASRNQHCSFICFFVTEKKKDNDFLHGEENGAFPPL